MAEPDMTTYVRIMFSLYARYTQSEGNSEVHQQVVGLARVPHRSTLSRRYKQLYTTIESFVLFVADYARALDACFGCEHLVEDKSLFKAAGPVWHQSDRNAGRVPAKLRHLDQDASWAKSGYQGWVYGYSLHLTCNASAFPTLYKSTLAPSTKATCLTRNAFAVC